MSISPRQKTPLNLGWMIWGVPSAFLALVIVLLIVHGAAQHRSSPAVAAEPSQAGQAAEGSQSPDVNGEQTGDPGTQGDPNQYSPTGDPAQNGMTPNVPTQNAQAATPQSSQAQGSPTYSPSPNQPTMTQVPNQGELGVEPMTPAAPTQQPEPFNQTYEMPHDNPSPVIESGRRPPKPPPVANAGEIARAIKTTEDAKDLMQRGYQHLNALGLNLQNNFRVIIEAGAQLDEHYGHGEYRGGERGFATIGNDGVPEAYILSDMGRDEFLEVFCHEATHIWSRQFVDHDQDRGILEGLARWVEYHVADAEGHTAILSGLLRDHEPYGNGLRCMLAIEQKYGPDRVLQFALEASKLDEAKSLGVTW